MSNEINVGAISEALNNKVDLNQLNTNEQGLEYVSGLSMPSDKYIDLTLGASGTTYIAPANGWVSFRKIAGAPNLFIELINYNSNIFVSNEAAFAESGIQIYLPVKKNDVFETKYNATGANIAFRFIYAQGEQ